MRINVTLSAAITSVLVTLAAASILLAGSFWIDRPYTRWSKEEASKLLTNSPWARIQTYTSETLNIHDSFIFRFYSALPVRQALARSVEFAHGGESEDKEKKQALIKRIDQMLNAKYPDHIILSITFESSYPPKEQILNKHLWTLPKETFKDKIFLITDRKEKIAIVDYFPPSDETTAKFVFPRHKDGKPLIRPTDKEIKVQFLINQALRDVNRPVARTLDDEAFGFKLPELFTTFKVKNMILNGELVL